MKYRSIHFTIPGIPQGKGRPRAARIGNHIRIYTPSATVSYEALIKQIAAAAFKGFELFLGPISMNIVMRFTPPKSWSEKKKKAALDGSISATVRPDGDNCWKAVADACEGLVYENDKEITTGSFTKIYDESSGVDVTICEINQETDADE